MNHKLKAYLSSIGRRGGLKSRRALSPALARAMVQVREARRAFKKFKAMCFWSYSSDTPIAYEDLPWVVEQLKKHGNWEAWRMAERLCR